jgi:hypothetical protein
MSVRGAFFYITLGRFNRFARYKTNGPYGLSRFPGITVTLVVCRAQIRCRRF